MSNLDYVTTELANNVLTLTLNKPEQRNALSEGMLGQLCEALLSAIDDLNVRVIVIAANGSVFSAGHHLKELNSHRDDSDDGREYFKKIMFMCSNLMQAIINHPKPVIAKVQGMATAAGCQLVASCDLAIASENSKFCTPGVNIGLFCSTPMVALSRNMSRKQAMKMLLLGDVIDAVTAQQYGLINQAVSLEELDEAVAQYCERLIAKSAVTLRFGKGAFYQQLQMPLSQAYEFTSEVMVDNMLHNEAIEGFDAFIAKRDPKWQHR
ncbi:MAG: enoyl-CoA hydratase [Gammaproteobacteria bacterium]|nr:enoyl-CoA hydratase [Gammaproteobacteria bacterium]